VAGKTSWISTAAYFLGSLDNDFWFAELVE